MEKAGLAYDHGDNVNVLDGHMLADGPLPDKAMKMQHPHLLDTKH
jgi:hypothetical protein